MTQTTQPPGPESSAGLPEHLRYLLASALGYFGARLELASIEGKEALGTWGRAAALVALALGLLAFGYLLLLLGAVAVLAWLTGWHWGWFALGFGFLHLVGTGVCLWLAKLRWGQPVFPMTFAEFRKDQQWLNPPNENLN